MKKTIIVTGIQGQDGSILADKYLKRGYKVIGIDLWQPTGIYTNLKEAIKNKNLILESGDITENEFIVRIIQKYKPEIVYNMAAISLVPESFKIPKRIMDVNTYAVINFLEAIRTYSPKTKFYQASCYDKKTRVLTKEGLKTYKEVKKGDLIYTINEKTNKLELKPVKKVVKSYYEGNEMIRLKGRRFNFLVTPNHRMLYNKNEKLFYEEASNTCKHIKYDRNSNLKLATPIWNGIDKKFISITHDKQSTINNHFDIVNAKDFLYLLGLYIGDGHCGKERKRKRYYTKEEQANRRNKDGRFKKILGTEKKQEVIYKNNLISFAIPKTDIARKKLLKVLNKYNIKYHDKHDINVYFSCSGLYSLFRETGKNVYEKHIPEQYLNYSKELLQYLYDGLIDSDGHRRNQRESFVTTSKKLSEQFVELVIKLGRICKINDKTYDKIIKIENRIVNQSKSYRICIAKKKTRNIYKHNLSKEYYKGLVWCLVMEDNHNFIVERDGFYMFSGNTSEQLGDNNKLPQNNESKMLPNSPYAISKQASYFFVKSYRTAFNLFAVNGMLFNHEGSRRGLNFVTRKITRAVANIKNNKQKVISLGNLNAKRDWGNAPDYVDAQIMMMEAETPDDYTVATGETHTIREFVEEAFKHIDLKITWKGKGLKEVGIDQNGIVRININEKYYRPNEVDMLCGDYSKIKKKLGWKPTTKFKELVKIMVESDLRNVYEN